MPYSVLILDDDADFNSLLTDIFEQAEYIVTSLTDPLEAVEVFRETEYDLVVTDHRMPEMTGVEFMKAIKKINPKVPLIMVSGYLENDTIRDLISEGVGGVFLKPLNIFSLLERTAELIEEVTRLQNATSGASNGSDGADEADGADGGNVSSALGFAFRSYPCKSRTSTLFAERLYSLRKFKSTLSLIGEPGTHYRNICEDICGFYGTDNESFIYLNTATFNPVQTRSLIEGAKQAGAERVTCVLLESEQMDDSQKKLAILLAKQEGEFEDIGVLLRTVFCVSGDLDMLFDEGLIDENLYILMGTAEVQVPPLRDCDEDVGVMAQQLLVEFARKRSLASVPYFERSARDLFRKHKWERNFEELQAVVLKLLDDNTGDVITHAAVKSVLSGNGGGSARSHFESHLSRQQLDYLRAAAILLTGDRSKTASFYGADLSVIESKMN